MADLLLRPLASMLLLVLLATGLVTHLSSGCAAMAAAPSMTGAHQAHCTDMPVKSGKPIKADAATCALCAALPGSAPTKVKNIRVAGVKPIAMRPVPLAGLISGPAPPPPRIA